MASDEMDRLVQNLRRLHLAHAANDLDEHLRQAAQLKLGHLAFLARVMEAEVLARTETGTKRRIDEALFPEVRRIEDFDFKFQPSLDRKQILDLAELGFLDRCQAVIWLGPSGVGKSHLAVALGVRACTAGYHVKFVRAYDLLRKLWAALADNTLDQVIDEYADPDLLVIDELTHSPRKPEQDFAAAFYELVQRRYRRGAIVLTSNLGFEQWPAALGTPSLVTPALDRLLDAGHVITFPPDAPSYRAKRREPPGPLPPARHKPSRRRHPRAR
ncbi:MAG: ATP-binding protein [Candidatus Rokubacteria bacterium]|nr:ATP-binding protein [Candidatus Rokubacteria bacterium]